MWEARPNPAHEALARLERKGRLHTLVTQNVDGLHQAAGSSPDITVEIHGTVHAAKCLTCGWRGPMEPVLDRVRAGDEDPACRACGGILKAATISFGEPLVVADLERAQDAAAGCECSSPWAPASGSTRRPRCPRSRWPPARPVVVANAQPTPFDALAEVVLREPLEELLPPLAERV